MVIQTALFGEHLLVHFSLRHLASLKNLVGFHVPYATTSVLSWTCSSNRIYSFVPPFNIKAATLRPLCLGGKANVIFASGCFNDLVLFKVSLNLIFCYLGFRASFSNSLLPSLPACKSVYFNLNLPLAYDCLLKATNFRKYTPFQHCPLKA